MLSAVLVSVSPLTGLNGLVAARESRALPWPNMFDAFGAGEITAPSATLAIIASTRIMLASKGNDPTCR